MLYTATHSIYRYLAVPYVFFTFQPRRGDHPGPPEPVHQRPAQEPVANDAKWFVSTCEAGVLSSTELYSSLSS